MIPIFWVLLICFIGGVIYMGFRVYVNLNAHQFTGEIINRVKTEEKIAALTFDDGPTDKTLAILDILDRADVKATFFLNGRDIENNMALTKAIITRGHSIGNHSYSHPKMIFKSMRLIENEIDETSRIIREAGYEKKLYFRAPYGVKFILLPIALKKRGLTNISWDIDTYINVPHNATVDTFIAFVLSKIIPGSIILMHPMLEERRIEIEALPRLIADLKKQGYQLKTIDEMLGLAG